MLRKLIAFVALCVPCMAQTGPSGFIQYSGGAVGAVMTLGTNYYVQSFFAGAIQVSGTNNSVYNSPSTGTLQNFAVSMSQMVGGNTVTFTVWVNTTPTAITCTMPTVTTNGAICSDYTHSAPVNQGDQVTVMAVCSVGCTGTAVGGVFAEIATGNIGYIQWQTTNANQTMTAGSSYAISPVNSAFQSAATLPQLASVPALETGTLRNFMVTGGNQAAGNAIQFFLFKNATATSLTCTLTSSNRSCMDLSDAIAVNQGDTIQVVGICSGTCGALTSGGFTVQVGVMP